MRIEAHLLHWQEKDIMPFVVKHYQKFCDHITIWDNYSKDGSAELAQSLGCEIKQFGNQWFDDSENQKLKNECWKGSKADFVVVADFDELPWQQYADAERCGVEFSGADMSTILKIEHDEYGTTIFKTHGWQIMSDQMPKDDLLEITNGFHFANYSKSIIFNPREIKEIGYGPGAHKCSPEGNVVWSEDELFVLHYKHIGGVKRTIDRYKEYSKRLSPHNRKHGHGIHYLQSERKLKLEWQERMKISTPLI